MRSVLPQQIDKRALIKHSPALMRTRSIALAQQALFDGLADAPEREHAAAQPQQHHKFT